MNFTRTILSIAAAASVCACSSSEITRYATTDMTWAEFYAAEVGSTAAALEAKGYDAVTSATRMKTKNYSQFVVAEDGSQIYGVKAVPVAMTEATYKKLAGDSRYTFVTDTVFASYKQVDKKGNFGKYSCALMPLESADASITSGSNSTWGHSTIRVNAQLKGTCIGVVLTCSDGTKVGLKPLDNIWFRINELGICVAEFKTPRGTDPTYGHTAVLEGKTITNIVYLFSDADAVSIDTELYVKETVQAKLEVEVSVEGNAIAASVKGLPEGYSLASVRKGRGWGAKTLDPSAVSFSKGVLSINVEDALQDTYRADFVHETKSDLAVSFDLSAEE